MIHYTTRINRPRNPKEEALLDLVATGEFLRKIGDRFFQQFSLTRAQFNALVLIREAGTSGLTQTEISKQMIVTAANVSGQIDRLEHADLVVRTAKDRRTNQITLTQKAMTLLDDINEPYFEQINRATAVLSKKETEQLSHLLSKLRDHLHNDMNLSR